MKKYESRKDYMNQLTYMEVTDIYEEVLSGRYIKIFPKGFWVRPEAKNNAAKIVKYLIEEKLKWSDEDIRKNFSTQILIDNRLSGMLQRVFNSSPYDAINNAYPDRFKPWELSNCSRSFWNKETGKEATKWLIEEKLKWSDEDIKNKLGQYIFKNNNLLGMLEYVFDNSPYSAINNTYPDKFKLWEFNSVPKNYWTLETSKEATKWLIEEKLKWSDEDIKNNLRKQTFIDNGLYGMITVLCNGTFFKIINNTYPDKFKPSDFKYGYKYKEM